MYSTQILLNTRQALQGVLDAKTNNAEGNEINNPAYDENKSGKKKLNCCSIKISD